MARSPSKHRQCRTISMMLIAALIASASLPASALSFSLPLETPSVPVKAPTVTVPTVTVEVPPVKVKAPPITVETPPVTVKTPPAKTPTVPVKTPTLPVKTPTVPVKTPTVPVKTPTVPAKAPVSTGSSKAPTVTVRTPNVSATAPGVSVKTPGASGSVSSGSAKGGGVAVPAQSGSSTRSAPSGTTETGTVRSSAGLGSASSGAAPAPSAEPLAAYGLGAGYGQTPTNEGAPGPKSLARIAKRERNLKALVARARGCLSSLPEGQQRLLELRSGLGQSEPLNPAATAARLHVGSARFARLEVRALRELRRVSAGGCGEATTAAAAASVMAFLGSSFGNAEARWGVKAVRYEAAPASPLPPASAGDKGLLGTKLSSAASDAILAFVLLLIAGVVMTAVVADASGNGPRHAQWRRQMRNRIRNWR
jgi:hypothetical protein